MIKKMMKAKSIGSVFLLLFLSLTGFNSVAQGDLVRISAQVLDQETGRPLPYANIIVVGKTIGTITNERGEFDFNIPDAFSKDSLKISYLGYQSFTMLISQVLKQKLAVVKLKQDPLLLQEVVVTDNTLEGKEIVKRAVNNIKNTFAKDDFILEGFYRYWFMMDNRDREDEATIAEAAVIIADRGYTKPSKEKLFVKEFRKIEAPSHQFGSNSLLSFFVQNPVKYKRTKANMVVPNVLSFPNKLNYGLENIISTDEGELYMVKVEIKEFFATYTIYIRVSDYAIERIDLQAQSPEGKSIFKKQADTTYGMVSINNTIRFRKFNNKNYLNYMRQNWTYHRVDSTNGVAEVGENYEELLVNNIVTGKGEVLKYVKQSEDILLKDNTNLFCIRKPYNESFWRSYNSIKENPLDDKLQKALRAPGKTLEETFRDKTLKVENK